jgi:hypothetical protein
MCISISKRAWASDLLFLGSWRSTLIVLISIPLSILTSIVILCFMGQPRGRACDGIAKPNPA